MQLKYNWFDYLQIENRLAIIYEFTKNNLLNSYKHEDSFDIVTFANMIANKLINYLEDFIYYLIKNNINLDKIITALNNFNCISFSNSILNNVIPLHTPPILIKDKTIILNSRLQTNDGNFIDEEKTRIYLYQAFTRLMLNFINENTIKFSKIYTDIIPTKIDKKSAEELIKCGWLLLETALSQEIASSATYKIIAKPRPSMTISTDANNPSPINNYKILSNFDSFRIFQGLLINFGYTLANIGTLENHSTFMINYKLTKLALDDNFTENVLAQFITNNQIFELYQLLYLLGIIYNSTYETQKISTTIATNLSSMDINKIYDKIIQYTMRLFTLEQMDLNLTCLEYQKPTDDITKYKLLYLIKRKEPYLFK